MIREFKAPDGVNKEDIDASGDGSVPFIHCYHLYQWITPCEKVQLLILLFWLSKLGDVLVVLDLRPDESLLEAGFAREVRVF